MGKLDPRTKFVGVVVLSILAFATYDLVLQMLFTLLAIVSLIVAGVGRHMLRRHTRGVLTVILFIFAIQCLIYPGGRHFLVRLEVPMTGMALGLLSLEGIHFGTTVALRFLTIIFLTVAFNASTPYSDFLNAMVKWRMPYSLALMINVALRMIPEMAADASDVALAHRARGVDPGGMGYRGRLRVLGMMLKPMVLRYLLRARTMAQALECRGLDPGAQRTMYRDVTLRGRDYACLLVLFLMAAFILMGGWTGMLRPEETVARMFF
jgi:energy-coupling factor transport system permease protein